MNRPSDKVTAGVVARKNGIDVPFMVDRSTKGTMPIIRLSIINGGCVHIKDPRDDDGAALELFHWLVMTAGWDEEMRATESGWMLWAKPEAHGITIPISGEPFRYAVVELVSKTLGDRNE